MPATEESLKSKRSTIWNETSSASRLRIGNESNDHAVKVEEEALKFGSL
jgi:hypothetical protein